MSSTVKEFLMCSGLSINIQKSQVLTCGMSEARKESLVTSFGCQIGSFPMKYLGVPLHNRSLRSSECTELIQKMIGRLNSWSNHMLSRSGRVVLVKSVIQAIGLYWARIFIIPAMIIKAINTICANFIWKGAGDRRGGHRINWKIICCPEVEGGLGIKCLKSMNEALILKQLWDVDKDQNLWHLWLNRYWTKGKRWWEMTPRSVGSWVINKLIKSSRFSDMCMVVRGNEVYWIGKGKGFSVRDAYETIRPRGDLVSWHALVWCPLNRPRDSFNAWLGFSERLLTKDRLLRMGLPVDPICELCKEKEENANHLFFECKIARNILDAVARSMNCQNIPEKWRLICSWFRRLKKEAMKSKACAMIITRVMYEIWSIRNNLIFRKEAINEGKSIKRIRHSILLKLGGLGSRLSSSRDRNWLNSINVLI